MSLPLTGCLVVALEQAVAGPLCTLRLADAGARVIKVERPEGDFARFYDNVARGQSSYFVWLNRGKESVTLDLAVPGDRALLGAMIARADVVVQNLKPGALARFGFAMDHLRRTHPRLITCSIGGYGEDGPYAMRKAYDLLIQAEAGLASLTGGPEAPARVGVSVVDIATGMNAYAAILEALLARRDTGQGATLAVSLFDAMAEWATVPLLQHEGGKPPRRLGLAHPSIAPYGCFATADGASILISVQSDREWRTLAREVLMMPDLAEDPAFATNVARVAGREQTDARVAAVFASLPAAELERRLLQADIAYGRVNDMAGLAAHPQLRRTSVPTPAGPVSMPIFPVRWADGPRPGRPVPAAGEHSAAIRAEFGQGA